MPVISGGQVIGGARAVPAYANAGAPTTNVTLLGTAVVGDQLVDTTNGKLYICTATNGTSTIAWTVVGAQT